ncbi:hypothetical protein E1H99_13230 [Enterococcus hirae]|nr:hypothetical protein E1H99_13230 [Enterococcus hirae]
MQLANQPLRQKDRSFDKINDFITVRLFCLRLNNLLSFQIQRGVLGLYYLHLLQYPVFNEQV